MPACSVLFAERMLSMRLLGASAISAVVAGALIAGSAANVRPAHTLELSAGRVDGHVVLGRTLAGVRAILGRPTFTRRTRWWYRAIWGRREDFRVMVIFSRAARFRATSIVFERGPLVDRKLGSVLALTPTRFQTAVEDRYGDHFVLVRPYRCRSKGLCTGVFDSRDGRLHITFGRTGQRGTFITMWRSSTARAA
jgi:hypothetical protein